MKQIPEMIRATLGLDDSLHRSEADSGRLRWRIGIGAAVFISLSIFAIVVVGNMFSGLGKKADIPEELKTENSPTNSVVISQADTGILVHVIGAVREPGIYEVPSGARVMDATMAAGGLTEQAQTCAINLAREVADGEQINVPQSDASTCLTPQVATGKTENASGATVSLNTGTVEDFDQLPGIGPTLAGRIIDWRQANGSFTSIEELGEVSGIGDKLFAGIRDRVTL